jgi:hypothetical protein
MICQLALIIPNMFRLNSKYFYHTKFHTLIQLKPIYQTHSKIHLSLHNSNDAFIIYNNNFWI